ncbi:uncharacterized protein TrAtP1_007828 [Trichoderma atroviride]|uniref:uncharacterized protein n=1 Tax=Hypocrea atroviridis TaxID=63577 RepID=UPI00332F4776|nr:hypothetical protein TrAtP1_007828 [Trichoderma atroviride]
MPPPPPPPPPPLPGAGGPPPPPSASRRSSRWFARPSTAKFRRSECSPCRYQQGESP